MTSIERQESPLSERRPLRILIIAHSFPPMNAIASHRPYSWARTWRDLGHEIEVLTPQKHAFDGPMDLKCNLTEIRIHEVPYLKRSKPAVSGATQGSDPHIRRWDWIKTLTRRARFSLAMFGDPRLLAYFAMVRRGLALLRERPFDVIVATSPPEVVFFVARTLSHRMRVPWIADFRDLWFRDTRLFQSRLASWLSGPRARAGHCVSGFTGAARTLSAAPRRAVVQRLLRIRIG
jgi:hypothetical protein